MTLEQEVARLRAANAELRALVAQLQEQLAAALARIAELEQQPPDPPAFVKPNRPQPSHPKPARKKRASQQNRTRRRQVPTRIETHALERCPDCHYQLRGTSLDYTRQVIELPPPPPIEVVEHRVIKRFCPCCRRWRAPQLDLSGHVLGQGRIGVRISSLIAYLRTTLRLPFRRIQHYLQTIHTLSLSAGELVELLHQVRHTAGPAIKRLKQQARASPILHADETSWREDGQNGYIWAFSTPGEEAVRYYEYDHSRGQVVVKRILDGQFHGHLVSDFYSGYNVYAGKHQRCWVHLLRDLHALSDQHAKMPEVRAWVRAVRAQYDAAVAWTTAHPQAKAAVREQHYVGLVAATHRLGLQYAKVSKHACCTLAKRLLRHEEELFQFVLVPALSADNNQAERSIRPLVVCRKISGGSRSSEGTKTRMALASLFETWQARQLNPFDECLKLLSQLAASPA